MIETVRQSQFNLVKFSKKSYSWLAVNKMTINTLSLVVKLYRKAWKDSYELAIERTNGTGMYRKKTNPNEIF